ncbi:aminoglycoside phosphotransferase family protein [Bacillus sp. FJAT-49705]|uniref:Aminoglycoside phosphotransferase family protein n=1 Tax=Cytobacillus citreus TaxID=2833586 RepID=A0ABS5NY46_9BACI|nr:aminoglycoside phosphotransferase family protein [Cytobacillus citreus]MBS4192018.1 aminoglycoside phosphotransferase family protein [Cytobacillus citreus]
MMNTSEKVDFIQKAFPTLKMNEIMENHRGWDNDIIMINHSDVFRFPKNEKIASKIEIEKQLLDLLSEKEPLLSIPAYKLLNDKNKRLICTRHKYIEGLPMIQCHDQINENETAILLGDFLTKLHSIEYKKTGLTTIHTSSYWNEFYSSIKKEAFPFLNQAEKNNINHLFNRFFKTFSNMEINKCVIHGDLTGANMIYHAEQNKLTGIIDFTDAQISDPAFDFAGIYWDFGAAFTKKVLSHYEGQENIDSIFHRVSSFYGLQPIFHELLYSIKNGDKIDFHASLAKLFKLQETLNN